MTTRAGNLFCLIALLSLPSAAQDSGPIVMYSPTGQTSFYEFSAGIFGLRNQTTQDPLLAAVALPRDHNGKPYPECGRALYAGFTTLGDYVTVSASKTDSTDAYTLGRLRRVSYAPSIIVYIQNNQPNTFGGTEAKIEFSGLYIYSPSGFAAEYKTLYGNGTIPAGSFQVIQTDNNGKWTNIIAGDFLADTNNNEELFFYDSASGFAEIATLNIINPTTIVVMGAASFALPKGLTQVVSGCWTGNCATSGLFTYSAATKTGQFYNISNGALVPFGAPKQMSRGQPTWTDFAVGSFAGPSYSDLFAYDSVSGSWAVYASDGAGGFSVGPINSLPAGLHLTAPHPYHFESSIGWNTAYCPMPPQISVCF